MPAQQDDWRTKAACLTADSEQFFIENDDEEIRNAKAICGGCPVREQCLDFALEANINHGIYGGKSPRQRKRIKVIS